MSGVALVPGKSQVSDANGNPLAGGTVDVYLAGTTTRTNSWQDQALTTLNTNPIVLDASGSCSMWLDGSTLYKLVVKNAAGATQSHLGGDNISGAAGSGALVSFLQSGTGAVSRSAQNKMRDVVSVKDFGAVGDGVTNDSTAIQAAIDDRNARGGGVVFFPAGTYKCNVILKSGVVLSAGMGGQFGYLPGTLSSVTLLQAAVGFVVDTPAGSTQACGVHGINFKGLGSATAGGGVRFQNVNWGSVKGCQFDNFADQGVLKNAGNANTFEDILTTNCLLNRTRTTQNGTVELAGGADDFMHRIEANPSLTGVTDANLRVCAIVVKAANVFVQSCIGEFGDQGWYVTASNGRFSNCRADLNWGHGFNTGGTSQYSNCTALNNSQATTNTYDGFAVNGQGDSFSNCRANCTGGVVHRYGFNDPVNVSAVNSRNKYMNCESWNHGTGAFSTAAFLGSAPIEPPVAFRGSGATPDLSGTTFYIPTDAGAVTITDFLGGYSGKTIRVLGNTNVTVANNANIATSTAANKTLQSSRVYIFTKYNGKWFEEAPGLIQPYTVTNVVTDRAYDASATTVAELANVLGTLLADLKSQGILQ